VYGRSYQDGNGTLWLEYWFWYYYNQPDNPSNVDVHEGDWENILLRMKSVSPDSYVPIEATYEQHGVPERCPYAGIVQVNGRPLVYVARGTHASYFQAGPGDWANQALQLAPDYNDAMGPMIDATADIVTSYTPGWMRWPGRCG